MNEEIAESPEYPAAVEEKPGREPSPTEVLPVEPPVGNPLGNVAFEDLARRAGVDVDAAKAKVREWAEKFPAMTEANEEKGIEAKPTGGIPAGARQRLVDECFDAYTINGILLGIIGEWESEARQ